MEEYKQYRRKPVFIDAVRWFKNGDHPEDGSEETGTVDDKGNPVLTEGKVVQPYRSPGGIPTHQCSTCGLMMHHHGWIDTLEGGHIVCPGDWVARGAIGNLYPIKDTVFVQLYESVE